MFCIFSLYSLLREIESFSCFVGVSFTLFFYSLFVVRKIFLLAQSAFCTLAIQSVKGNFPFILPEIIVKEDFFVWTILWARKRRINTNKKLLSQKELLSIFNVWYVYFAKSDKNKITLILISTIHCRQTLKRKWKTSDVIKFTYLFPLNSVSIDRLSRVRLFHEENRNKHKSKVDQK